MPDGAASAKVEGGSRGPTQRTGKAIVEAFFCSKTSAAVLWVSDL